MDLVSKRYIPEHLMFLKAHYHFGLQMCNSLPKQELIWTEIGRELSMENGLNLDLVHLDILVLDPGQQMTDHAKRGGCIQGIWTSMLSSTYNRALTCRILPCSVAADSGAGQVLVTCHKPKVVHACLLNGDGLLECICCSVVVLKVDVQDSRPSI